MNVQDQKLEARIAELEHELERSEFARKYTQEWYAGRYGKVQEWARTRLPEPWVTEFFCCVANGVHAITKSDYFKPERITLDQTQRAEESELAKEAAEQKLAHLCVNLEIALDHIESLINELVLRGIDVDSNDEAITAKVFFEQTLAQINALKQTAPVLADSFQNLIDRGFTELVLTNPITKQQHVLNVGALQKMPRSDPSDTERLDLLQRHWVNVNAVPGKVQVGTNSVGWSERRVSLREAIDEFHAMLVEQAKRSHSDLGGSEVNPRTKE